MTLTGESRSTWRKICSNASLPKHVSNSSRRSERPAPNRLKIKVKVPFCPMPHFFRKTIASRFPCCVSLSFGWEQHVDVDERPEFDPRPSMWDLWGSKMPLGQVLSFLCFSSPLSLLCYQCSLLNRWIEPQLYLQVQVVRRTKNFPLR
jgi:hypothetical protein